MKGTLDKVLESIKMSFGPLAQQNVKIMTADCDSNYDLHGCKNSDNLHNAVLYRYTWSLIKSGESIYQRLSVYLGMERLYL